MDVQLLLCRPFVSAFLALVLGGASLAQAALPAAADLKRQAAELAARVELEEARVRATGPAFQAAFGAFAAKPLSASDSRAAHAGTLDALPATVRAEFQAALPAAAAHHAALEAYFAAYDAHAAAEMDAAAVAAVEEVAAARADLAAKLGEGAVKGLDRALAALRTNAAAYWAVHELPSGSKDGWKKLEALRTFGFAHVKVREQVRKLRVKAGDVPGATLGQKLSALEDRVRRLASNLKLRTSVYPWLARFVAYLAAPKSAPDPDRMSELMHEMGQAYLARGKIQVTVRGREQVPAGKKLIYAPSHRGGFIDSMIMCSLVPGRFAPLATFRYFPEMLKPLMKRWLAEEPGMVPVDLPGVEVVQRAIELVRSGRTLLIFPEGNIPSPLKETRAPRSGVERIAEGLLDEDVAIVPITIDDTAIGWGVPKYGHRDRPQGMAVSVYFDRAIPARYVYALSGGREGLLRDLIREHWHRHLVPSLAAPAAAGAPVERLEAQADYRPPLAEE